MPSRRDIDRLQDEIQELFADLWQVPRFAGGHHGYRPAVDCFQTQDPAELTVVVEVPGIDPSAVEVVVSGRVLLIAGERRRERCPGRIYNRVEIDYGRFQRQIPLPADVDGEGARASYERGLLTIVLPLAERPAPVERVSIEVTRS